MSKHNPSSSQGQQSGKVRIKPLEGCSFGIADYAVESDICTSSDDETLAGKVSTSQSCHMLSTAELISVVGHIWGRANDALAHLQSKASVHPAEINSQIDNNFSLLVENGKVGIHELGHYRYLHVNLKSSIFYPSIVQTSLENSRLRQKKVPYVLCDDQFIQNLCSRNKHHFVDRNKGFLKVVGPVDGGIQYSISNAYGRPSGHVLLPEFPVSVLQKSEKVIEKSDSEAEAGLLRSSGTSQVGFCHDVPNIKDLSEDASSEHVNRSSICSQRTDYSIQAVHNASDVSNKLSLGLNKECSLNITAPDCYTELEMHETGVEKSKENGVGQHMNLDSQVENGSESSLSQTNLIHPFLAKQEHAISGALAGTFVSLCLHPIDTIKTMVQSCRANQKSIYFVGQSLLSERGVSGLYRGVTSNITTSAPISAIYTFTYESVKGSLLPLLSKEYHSVAHCTAGACASIATSFLFTPSERIKQQMQVNNQYQSCWNAAHTIIRKGGLPSLYAGWGAVLCRNIPHSVIKFYTYESLKQLVMASQPSSERPGAVETLLCGGTAGSAAALFSTPFDVVKTRLQTQTPGSRKRYDSIRHALHEIYEHEGVRGLYRGLIPRLVMYMSQGALFFASYEIFKSLFPIELHQHKPEKLQYKEDADDDPLLSL